MNTSAAVANQVPVVRSWIGGRTCLPRRARTTPVYDPATGRQTKSLALADAGEIKAAVAAAAAAFPDWRDLSVAKRQAIMFRFRELLEKGKGELAEIITSEHGKALADAAGEVTRGMEVVDLACGFPHFMKGAFSENVSAGVDVYTIKQPLGVVGVISPFNFPAMVPLWFFPIAMACGNTVVLKPSEKDPSAAVWLAELWQRAGLPDGVFNVLQGDKLAVDGLLEAPEVRSISFVGSTPIARYVYESAAQHGKRVQALGGANNHMLVLPDADLDMAADQAVSAGYGSAGERCMAQSVVLAVDPVGDQLVSRISERIAKLRIGSGWSNPDMGPLITAQHRDRVRSYIDMAAADGGDIVVDGRDFCVDGAEEGFWLGPTLIDKLPLTSRAYSEEIFGPVLSVVRVKTLQEGIDLINSGRFGNGTAIFTRSGAAARRFQHEIQVGMIGINVPIPVPVAYHSFGGWRDSLFGSAKAYGVQGFDFFTQEKAVTSRWASPAADAGMDMVFPQND